MGWTWEAIERDWLAGARVATPPADVVSAFAVAEELLGPDWIEARRQHAPGSHPVAGIISMGKRLAAVRDFAGFDALLKRIQDDDASASAELTAAYLCIPDDAEIEFEFYPRVRVGGGDRMPDFRLRRPGGKWTYVEAAAPDVSELQQAADALVKRLLGFLPKVPLGSAAEIMVRRDLSDEDVRAIEDALHAQLEIPGPSRRDLPGLARVLVRSAPPGQLQLLDNGEPVVPRIGAARAELRGGAQRHLTVRLAFSDPRAEKFLASEAQQLPTDSPGLVMLDVGRAVGAINAWEPLLRRRLQPKMHTRVSGIVLFVSGMWALADGEAWVPWTRVLDNGNAPHGIPKWLTDRLRSWGRTALKRNRRPEAADE
jgi:hypothetical protein